MWQIKWNYASFCKISYLWIIFATAHHFAQSVTKPGTHTHIQVIVFGARNWVFSVLLQTFSGILSCVFALLLVCSSFNHLWFYVLLTAHNFGISSVVASTVALYTIGKRQILCEARVIFFFSSGYMFQTESIHGRTLMRLKIKYNVVIFNVSLVYSIPLRV
jgi:hypothetical protein